MSNAILIGKIISWPNMGDGETEPCLTAGRGEIVALLDDSYLLIRAIPRPDEDEPLRMLALSMKQKGIFFWDTLEQEETWYDWVIQISESKPVISLASRKPRDHEH